MTDKITKALQAAAQDPTLRNDFYRTLLDAHVYMLVTTNPGIYGDITGVLEQETMPVVYWEKPDGKPVVPFFSSKKVLKEALNEEQYLKMPASTVFELTRGMHLILNPMTDNAKELHPSEVDAMLSGEIFEMLLAEPQEEDDLKKDLIHHAILFTPGPNWQDGKELSEQPFAIDHLRHFATMQMMGHLMLGGPFFAQEYGSLMICRPDVSGKMLQDIVVNDPAVSEGILKFEIIPWYLILNNIGN